MKVILFLLSLWVFTLGFVQPLRADNLPNEDSIILVLANQPHDIKRLELLFNLVSIDDASVKGLSYSSMLLEEAVLQNNNEYKALALYHRLVFYYMKNDLKMVQRCMKEVDLIARKTRNYDVLFRSYHCMIDLYVVNENYELAIDEATIMLDDAKALEFKDGEIMAYLILAEAYSSTSRREQALEMIQYVYDRTIPSDSLLDQISILTRICTILDRVDDNQNLKKYLDLLSESINKYVLDSFKKDPIIEVRKMTCAIFYVSYYIRANQPELVQNYFQKTSQVFTKEMHSDYRSEYYKVSSRYYSFLGKYQKAIIETDSLLNSTNRSFPRDYTEALAQKAELLALLGEKRKAIPIYQDLIALKDSIRTNVFEIQMEHMRAKYKLDELLLIQGKKRNRMEKIALGTLFFIFLVLAFIAFLIYRSRGKLRLSEQELRLATEQMEEANQVKEHFLSNMNSSVQNPVNTVIQYSNLIADNPELNEVSMHKYSSIIQKNSDYLLGLINDVLELSRLESGTKVFSLSVCNMVSICEEAINVTVVKNDNKSRISFQSDLKEAYVEIDVDMMSKRLSEILKSGEGEEVRNISFYLEKKENQPILVFRIYGSYLSEETDEINPEINLQNDMNRLVFEHMGGMYHVVEKQGEDKSYIYISFPLCERDDINESNILETDNLDIKNLGGDNLEQIVNFTKEMEGQITDANAEDLDDSMMESLIADGLTPEELEALKEEMMQMKAEKLDISNSSVIKKQENNSFEVDLHEEEEIKTKDIEGQVADVKDIGMEDLIIDGLMVDELAPKELEALKEELELMKAEKLEASRLRAEKKKNAD